MSAIRAAALVLNSVLGPALRRERPNTAGCAQANVNGTKLAAAPIPLPAVRRFSNDLLDEVDDGRRVILRDAKR